MDVTSEEYKAELENIGEALDALEGEEPFRLLCLSTCSYEFTDARTIVLTVMRPYTSEEIGGQ